MLDVGSAENVTRIAGDDVTGFWERTPQAEEALPDWMRTPPPPAGGTTWRVEAYSWGALTSGAKGSLSRALWLLLTPFALANIAAWARPALSLPREGEHSPAGTGPTYSFSPQRWSALVVRLAGLGLTCLLITGAAIVSIDLVAFQCFRGGDLLCPSLPSQLQFLSEPDWEHPMRRVAIGAAGPLLVLAALWLLGRATAQRYEDVPDRSEGTDAKHKAGAAPAGGSQPPVKRYPHLLEATAMWNGRRRWRWLASTHLLVGLATVLVLTGAVAHLVGGGWSALSVTGVGLGATLGVLAVAFTVLASDGPETEGPWEPDRRTPPGPRLRRVALWATRGGVALTVGYVGWLGVDLDATSGLEFIDLDVLADAMVVLSLLVGIGVVLGLVTWRDPGRTSWPIRVGVVVPLLGSAGIGVAMLRGGGGGWYAVVLLGLLLAALVHHAGGDSDRRRSWGFRGSGPGVFLGGALFFALLFTTSAVVGVLVWLGGSANLGQVPTAYTPPALCPDHPGAGDTLDCSAAIAVGDLELVDGSVTGPASAPVVESGRLSVERLEVAQDGPAQLVAVPSLTVGSGGKISLVTDADGIALTSSTPGDRNAQRFVVSAGTQGTTSITVQPGVVVEVRDPPYSGELVIPDAVRSFAAMFPVVLLGTVVLGVSAHTRSRRMTKTIEDRIAADIAGARRTVPPFDLPPALRAKIATDAAHYAVLEDLPRHRLARAMARKRRGAALARRGETLLAQLGLLAGAAMLVSLVHAAGSRLAGARGADAASGLADSFADLPVTAGLYLCVGAAAGLVALGTRVHKDSAIRRPVGVLWDLSCFWPRVAHPFSPPCYAERAVPDLYERLRFATTGSDRALLSGHSLGSFLCVAAILRLPHDYWESSPPEPRQRSAVALLTYGSQLRYYWGRVFPGAFGPQVLGNAAAAPAPGRPPGRLRLGTYEYPKEPPAVTPRPVEPGTTASAAVAAQLGADRPASTRWVNIYRPTDPLGFTVLGDDAGNPGGGRQHLLDRPVSEVTLSDAGDPSPPVLLGHSGYPRSSDYHEWAWTLGKRVSSTTA